MTERIIYPSGDGGVCVVIPAPGMLLEEVIALAVPAGVAHTIVDVSALPADRYFRDAWKSDLSIDMDKAREIHKEVLRRQRKPLLEALDVDSLRAIEANDTALLADTATKKQSLRDAPANPAIQAASTPEALRLIKLEAKIEVKP